MRTTTEHNEPTTSRIRRATVRLALATAVSSTALMNGRRGSPCRHRPQSQRVRRDRSAVILAADDRIVELLEQAARLADHGDAAQAGGLALEAAALLPSGDLDRHSTFASAAVQLAAAGRHAMAAEA